MSRTYYTAKEAINKAGLLLQPPGRTSLWEHSSSVFIDTPGGYSGPYNRDLVPYFKKVCEAIHSRKYKMVVLAAPAQSSKTQSLLINFLLWMIENDPHDVLLMQTSMERARDFSRRELDRALRANPVARQAVDWRQNNTFSKRLKNGVIISVQWPSSKVLAGRALRTIVLTDHDRVTSLDEGGVAELSLKRTTTFKSRGKVIVESSPSFNCRQDQFEYIDGSHEAPPVEGTLGLYNSGTQNRLYLKCTECGEYFLPAAGYDSIYIPKKAGKTDTMKARAQAAKIICKSNGCLIDAKHQATLRKTAEWVAYGEKIDQEGNVSGQEEGGGDIASFWLTGISAAFQTLSNLCLNYLTAVAHYERTGSEAKLASVTNVDMGVPYFFKADTRKRDPSELEEKAKKEMAEKGQIPINAHFIVATADTQKRKWVCQITAYGEAHERWVIDRFNLKYSKRTKEDGVTDFVNPGMYAEDWDLLAQTLLNREYTQEGTGDIYRPAILLVDSAGAPGVTENAYRWWRRMKGTEEQRRVVLIKGASRDMANNIKLSRPDSSKVGARKTISAGDVPVLMLSVNKLKDAVFADLQLAEHGPGFIHLPNWIGSWFFDELVAESIVDGEWKKVKRNSNNEAFDLLGYAAAAVEYLGYGKVTSWERKPLWARAIGETNKEQKKSKTRQLGNRGRIG